MSTFVGTWLYDTTTGMGDTVRYLGLSIRNKAGVGWGTAVALGWTPVLRVWKAGAAVLSCTVTGSWETNVADPESRALFAIGDETTMSFVAPTTTLVPAVGSPAIEYDAQIVMVDSGGTHVSVLGPDDLTVETFTFRVGRFP